MASGVEQKVLGPQGSENIVLKRYGQMYPGCCTDNPFVASSS